MDLEIKLYEGQSGILKITPTFEGKPVVDKIMVDWANTDMKNLISLGKDLFSADRYSLNMRIDAGGVASGTGQIVFRYLGMQSDKENLGKSTKNFKINILPAVLKVDSMSPTTFKWVPGQEMDITIKWMNQGQSVIANDKLLDLTTEGDGITIVSRSASGVRVKIKDGVDPNTLPMKEQAIIAKYYSGSAKSVLNYAIKPTLTINTLGPVNLKGKGSASVFPFKILEGSKDVTGTIKNIKASDPYLSFNADGSFTVTKVDLIAVTRTLNYTFDYVVNGLVWSYTAKITVTIGTLINL